MPKLDGKKVAILATDGFEQSELTAPQEALKQAGATVDVVSPKQGKIRGWNHTDWGDTVQVDKALESVTANDYDALVLPGGQINPDLLRLDQRAVGLVRAFYEAKKPIGAICHGPWLLIEAKAIKGREATSYASIKTDMVNAGAKWVDKSVVVDEGLVTSRSPKDLPDFCKKLVEEIAEGRHRERSAA